MLYLTTVAANLHSVKSKSLKKFRRLIRSFEKELGIQVKSDYNCGVTVVQCHTLLELAKLGKCNLNQLAASLHLDKSTVSRTINGLVDKGMVERTIPPENRRITQLVLSEKGKEICHSINLGNDKYFKEVLKVIPPDSQENFLSAFEKMISKMDEINSRHL